MEDNKKRHYPDRWIILAIILLCCCGVVILAAFGYLDISQLAIK